MNRSFYLPRSSGLHSLHPLTKLVLVIAILIVGFLARSPNVPITLFIGAILPLAFWGGIVRDLLRVTMTLLLPFTLSIVIVQGLFYPGASTHLFSFGPISFKEQGLIFAYATASRILLLAGAGLLLLFSTHPADLMLALEQRGLPSALSYILLAAIQLLPQMQAKAMVIMDAQRARGLETTGNLIVRVRAMIPLIAPLIFGALGQVDERAMALEARAFSAPQSKTSFKELRDTSMQNILRWLTLFGAVAIGIAEVWLS